MFYSQFILAKKGPLGTIWIAAHLERKLRKNQVTETNISVSVDSILFPEVPIALRLSGHLLLGVVRIYSRKVNYLFHDCSEALVKIKQAFHAGAVDLPPEAATAPFHSITLPETFDLDEFEPLPDREMHLLHSNGAADHHVTTREQITLQETLEDSSYLESQFGMDERFPEGDVPRMGIDFDVVNNFVIDARNLLISKHTSCKDLLGKSSREASPDSETGHEEALQEDEVLQTNMDEGNDYDQMDRMEVMDMDDQHEPGTPALGMDNMDLDYQPEVEGIEDGDVTTSPRVIEDLEPDRHSEQFELDNFEPDLNKPDQLEPATPGTLEPEEEEGKGDTVEEAEKEKMLDGDGVVQKEGPHESAQMLEEEDVPLQKVEVEKQEQEGMATKKNEDDIILDKEEDNQEVDNMDDKISVEDNKGDDENRQDVPGCETVMSVVEVPNQEPHVFDLDQDIEREMPSMIYKDQDEYMEDKEVVLVEDREVDMELDNPLLTAEKVLSPLSSPQPMPTFNPDALPGDDDVLASLLGTGTPALQLIPTPNETAVVVKPRRKQGQRKRKIMMDMNTILPADVMREQLMHTDDIRRVRRKAPCTRQELWSVQKDALGQQIFSEHSVPGLCSHLRVLFQRVYVSGEADLPLADDVQAEPEPCGNEEVPEQQGVFTEEDVVREVHEDLEVVEPNVEPVTEDEELQGSVDEVLPNEPDVEREPLEITMNEFAQEQSEARSADDGREEGNASRLVEHDEASAAEGSQLVGIEENEISDADQVPAEAIKNDDTDLSPSGITAADKSQNILLEDTLLSEGHVDFEEKQDSASVTEEVAAADVPAPGAEVAAPEPEVEVERVDVVENVSEEMVEDITDVVVGDVQEVLPSKISDLNNVEEQKDLEEEAPAPTTDDGKLLSPPIEVEEAHPIDEQPVVEELGFLADAGDTVFLAADDDYLCEEAEDFHDGNEYAQKEKLVQDNSGWSARTRAVGHYLRSTLESKYAHMRKREEDGTPKLGLEQILVGKSRKEAARMFFETLVLKTKDYIHVEQESPYGDIHISARPKLVKANF